MKNNEYNDRILKCQQLKLHNEFKQFYKDKETKDKKVSKFIKEDLKELIFNTKDIFTLQILKQHKFEILNNIPNINEEINESKEELYKTIINIIKEKLNNEKYIFILKKDYSNNGSNLFNLLDSIFYIDECIDKETINRLLNIVKKDSSIEKIKTSILLIHISYNIKDKELMSDFAYYVEKAMPDKIDLIYELLSNINVYQEKNIEIIKLFKYYIEKEENQNYNFYMRKLINIFTNNNLNTLKPEYKKRILLRLLTLTHQYYDNNNLDLVLSLYRTNDKEFWMKDVYKIDFELQEKIISIIINLDNDYVFKSKFIETIDKVILPIKNKEIQNYLLDKIKSLKSINSLILINDLYPIIIKYIKQEEIKNIVNDIYEIEQNEDSIKKVLLPISKEKINNIK